MQPHKISEVKHEKEMDAMVTNIPVSEMLICTQTIHKKQGNATTDWNVNESNDKFTCLWQDRVLCVGLVCDSMVM